MLCSTCQVVQTPCTGAPRNTHAHLDNSWALLPTSAAMVCVHVYLHIAGWVVSVAWHRTYAMVSGRKYAGLLSGALLLHIHLTIYTYFVNILAQNQEMKGSGHGIGGV